MAHVFKHKTTVQTTGSDAPNALAFCPNGRVLLVGGEDSSVHFWDVEAGTSYQESIYDVRWGCVTDLLFLPGSAGFSEPWLCIGTGAGLIALYQLDNQMILQSSSLRVEKLFPAADDPIELQAFDVLSSTLVVGSFKGSIKAYRWADNVLSHMATHEMKTDIPCHFSFSTANPRTLLVHYRSGAMEVLDLSTLNNLQPLSTLGFLIGSISTAKDCKVVANLTTGNYEVFDGVASLKPKVSLQVSDSSWSPKPALLSGHGDFLLCGGDAGLIHLFNLPTKRLPSLEHPDCQTVQALACTEPDAHGSFLVASANSVGICIWKHTRTAASASAQIKEPKGGPGPLEAQVLKQQLADIADLKKSLRFYLYASCGVAGVILVMTAVISAMVL